MKRRAFVTPWTRAGRRADKFSDTSSCGTEGEMTESC
jgi:hypothetical protein